MIVLIDTGFVIALSDPSDEHAAVAREIHGWLVARTGVTLLVAWPILYEAVSTSAERKGRLRHVLRAWRQIRASSRVAFADDQPFREKALQQLEDDPRRDLALVDRVLRAMIAEGDWRFDGVVTFNPGDFSDVCAARGVRLITSASDALGG